MSIPFLDLKIQYESIKSEVNTAIQQVMDSTAFAGGPFVSKFEDEFARYCQSEYAIGVGSGTEALWLALWGLGVGRGDEVITVPNTFIATAEAISLCGATPVFIDIDERTYNLDPALLEAAITSNTKAIIPVHLYGQPADMEPIIEVAKKYGLFVIEDACQSHGAEYKSKKVGLIGDVGCFSFYPGKNLGAYGEAGALITNNVTLADKLKYFRDHGQAQKYYHRIIGWNARMDGIQGAILSVKLKHLDTWNNSRRNNAASYNKFLSGSELIYTPYEASYAKHVYHVYAIRIKDRDQALKSLMTRGISCGVHYPVPIYMQDAYKILNIAEGACPVSEMCASETLSLPMYPELEEAQIYEVVSTLFEMIKK